MKPLFIFYPGCSTCAKATQYLKETGIDVERRDILTDTPTAKELTEWIARSSKPVDKFFNTSGIVYREMQLKDKLKSMTDHEKITLLASNGKLIRRPLLVTPDVVYCGFKESEYQTLTQ